MPLKTEVNTPEMAERVLAAFLAGYYHTDGDAIQAQYEHGQWWIHNIRTGTAWAAVDAEGRGAIDGFAFEKVSQGEDE